MTENMDGYHVFAFSGVLETNDTSEACTMMNRMLDESPTLKSLCVRVDVRHITPIAHSVDETEGDGIYDDLE